MKAMSEAEAVVHDAGRAGGLTEVVALARYGWPSDRELEGCASHDVKRAALEELARQMAAEMPAIGAPPEDCEADMRMRWGRHFVPEAFALACQRLGHGR